MFKNILIFLIVGLSIYSQVHIMNVYDRDRINLNGNWQTIIDPYENGYYSFHLAERREGYFIDYIPKKDERAVEHVFNSSHTLVVPGDWNTQREDLFFYEGTIWYRKNFDFKKETNQRYFIYFGAVNYEAIVYLNGEKLGKHEGGFTPFAFEVTEKIKDGYNYLIVKADNQRKKDAVPTVMTDWWNFGGITRDVFLVKLPKTYIEDYFIQLEKESTNKIIGKIKLNGSSSEQEILLSIPELEVSEKFKADKNGLVEFGIEKNVELWSPENPKLYNIRISSGSDIVNDKIGFRSISTNQTNLLLNNKEIYLRGISIHEVMPYRNGRAHSKEDANILLSWAKDLGCNFVRLAHYPHNEHMVKLADEMGLLVWSEIPVYWAIEYTNDKVYLNAENQMLEMIQRDKNRASIILWSIANETPVIDVRNKFLGKLAAKVKEVDPTRLLTAAMRVVYKDNVLNIDDPLGKVTDVLGVNQYIGWYEGKPDKCREIEWKSPYNKPVIVSEFGGGALFGLRGEKEEQWTEDYQAWMYEEQIEMLNKVPFVIGMSPWILTDFYSPRRPLYGIQDWFNRKGLISSNGEKKLAFEVLQEYYNRKTEK